MVDTFREGWTERIKYALTHDGQALDLTGLSVALVGKDRNGNTLAFTTVGIANAVGGVVYFDPANTDLLNSNGPYKLRWAISDGSGRTAYFPRLGPMVWRIDLP